jgi:hypothetical protein
MSAATVTLYADVATHLRAAMGLLSQARDGELIGRIGSALDLALTLAGPTVQAKPAANPAPTTAAAAPVKDPAETSRVALQVGTINAMRAACGELFGRNGFDGSRPEVMRALLVKMAGRTAPAKTAEPKATAETLKPAAEEPKAIVEPKAAPEAPKPAMAKPEPKGLAAYHAIKSEAKARGLSTKGSKAELEARVAADKAAAKSKKSPKPNANVPQAVAVNAPTLCVADGNGGFRPATDDEILAAADHILAASTRKSA